MILLKSYWITWNKDQTAQGDKADERKGSKKIFV
jgi:hypothetical protein